jgi:alpha-amylase/alpha-mannosidase (GH57 family)
MKAAFRHPVVLLWHMHQPQYRDPLSGEYILPWVYLHAIKDYVDMAAHLEANPAARAVINFTPVLLEQLDDLADRVAAHLRDGRRLPDPVLAMLAEEPLPADAELRLQLLQACLRANRQHLVERYPRYAELVELAGPLATTDRVNFASDQYLRDLAMWFHIAWLGETVKRSDPRVAALTERGHNFTAQHRRIMLELISGLLSGVLPRYRMLQKQGRAELATSPYAHPLMPLLVDFHSARDAMPGVPLPRADNYPGGTERALWHMRVGTQVFEETFGVRPAGCWPSEGAISSKTLEIIEDCGYRWTASGGNVLRGCLAAQPDGARNDAAPAELGRAWRVPDQRLQIFFRNDELSDLIGFTYSSWHGDDAVGHLVSELERIARQDSGQPGRLTLIALDGENAWEHYPFNGFYFLNGLYAALADHAELELMTLATFLDRGHEPAPLPKVTAGSWVYGTLSTWIGERDKNAAWDLLVEAKRAADLVLSQPDLAASARARIEQHLALCESSDWFWWLGEYNPAESVREFDELFRHRLSRLYDALGQPVPAILEQPLSVGRGQPATGGVMRRASKHGGQH